MTKPHLAEEVVIQLTEENRQLAARIAELEAALNLLIDGHVYEARSFAIGLLRPPYDPTGPDIQASGDAFTSGE